MFTKSLQAKLEKQLKQLGSSTDCFNIEELRGFMHAVAITPDILQPEEWLSKIFNGHLPQFDSEQQAEQVIGTMIEAYNHCNALREKGQLNFPYDIGQIDAELLDVILDWGWGFLTGLNLRMDIWLSRVVAKELGIDDDPVENSVAVVKALVDESFDTTPMLMKIKEEYSEDVSSEELEKQLIALLLTVLPEAVNVLQDFAETMDERRTAELVRAAEAERPRKIGRNQPCPCGSGKKYKKCCALTGDDEFVH